MKLHTKTFLIVFATLICLTAALYIVSRGVLFSGFYLVEQADTKRNVDRAVDAIQSAVDNLSTKAADWANWDDTYRFINDHNQDYIKGNVQPDALVMLKINMIVFLDTGNHVVFSRFVNLETELESAMPTWMDSLVLHDSTLVRHDSLAGVHYGLRYTPSGPLMLVARPILTSDGAGPIRGTLIFGRYLDQVEVARLSAVTHLALSLLPLDRSTKRPVSADGCPSVQALSDDSIAGYTTLADINGAPILTAEIKTGRAIFKQGQATARYLIIAIVLVGLVFLVVIMVLLERTVLARTATLTASAHAIADSGNAAARVALLGHDELGELSKSINRMLSTLEESQREIRELHAEMALVLNTVPSALLSLNEQFVINPAYSRSAALMFGYDELAGLDYFNVLGLTAMREGERQQLFDFLDMLRQEIIPEKEMAGLNPFDELLLEGRCWLRLRYYLIHRGVGQGSHILVLADDITQEKALAERAARSERENVQLKAVAEDPETFREFMAESCIIVSRADTIIAGLADADTDWRAMVNEIFRAVHTIKGMAGSFCLSEVSEIAGLLEERLKNLREAKTIDHDIIALAEADMARLKSAFAMVRERTRVILGDDDGERGEYYLRMALSRVKQVSSSILQAMHESQSRDELQASLRRSLAELRMVPFRKGVARSLKVVPGLIDRLGKKAGFSLENGDSLIDCELARELNIPLVHLIRNAFDHGLEHPEERLQNGKPAAGMVTVGVKHRDGTLVVTVTDDGRGIDPEKIKQAALSKNLIDPAQAPTMSVQDVYGLLFVPGFSTAVQVTDVSGRGVGMDAVLMSVQETLKGTIVVDSEIGKGSIFTITIPCNAA